MSTEQDLTTHGRARLSFASDADIEEFVRVLDQYERGELTAYTSAALDRLEQTAAASG